VVYEYESIKATHPSLELHLPTQCSSDVINVPETFSVLFLVNVLNPRMENVLGPLSQCLLVVSPFNQDFNPFHRWVAMTGRSSKISSTRVYAGGISEVLNYTCQSSVSPFNLTSL
jgi:hypothetical protein